MIKRDQYILSKSTIEKRLIDNTKGFYVCTIAAIYLALNILDKLTKGIDEFEELKKGNVAVALEMAGVIITVAIIIQSGVLGITAGI